MDELFKGVQHHGASTAVRMKKISYSRAIGTNSKEAQNSK
jgi:hypothetical protein